MTDHDYGLDGFNRARFEESLELARTQLAFPLPDPETELETDAELDLAVDPAIDDEERER